MIREAGARSNQTVVQLVVSWILMIPLLYYAGGWWWQTEQYNNRFEGDFRAVMAQSQTAENTITFLVLFAIVFWLVIPKIKSIGATCRSNLLLAVLPLLAIASSLWSQLPLKSLEWGICLAVSTLFAFYLARRLSIALVLFVPSIGLAERANTLGAWKGVYSGKNNLSRITLFLLPAAFYIPARTLLSKVSRIAYIGLSILLIVMAKSAGGTVGLSCLVAYFIATKVIKKFRSSDRVVVLVMIVTLALMVGAAGILYFDQILYFLGKSPTLTGRTAIWAASITSVMKRPLFGYGYMAFWRGLQGASAGAVAATGWAVPSAHNGFLEVWLELGAVGVALVLFPLIKAILDSTVCFRDRESSYYLWYLSMIVLAAITNLDETAFAQPNEITWVLFILACVELSEGAKRTRNGLHG